MKKNTSIPNLFVYFLVFSLGVFLIIAFRPNFAKLYELRTHLSKLKQKLLLEEKRNYFLKKDFNGLSNDPDYIEKIAREKLGWCRPTETVYRFQTNMSAVTDKSSDSNK